MTHEVLIDGVLYVPADGVDAEPPLQKGYISEHFRIAEFDCNHCGNYGERISNELLRVLEEMRKHFGGKPVSVSSGVRCAFHNENEDGAENSRHLPEHADAADVRVRGVASSEVYRYFTEKYRGRYGIGRYNSFTHIDTRPGPAARW